MAASAYQTRRARHRREQMHRRVPGCGPFEGVAVQNALSRSLRGSAPAGNAPGSRLGMTKHECRVELITTGEIRAPFPTTVVLFVFAEASWIRSIHRDEFRLTRKDNPSRMRCVLRRTISAAT